MYSLLIVYVMIPFFFIILFFGERSLRSCSLVILISCILNILSDNTIDLSLTPREIERLFIFNCNISILWDSACALLLITSKLFNQESGKQALLLCFAVLCHIMVAYGLSGFFRNWYVELILVVSALQMLVAYHGFRAASIELWKFGCWMLDDNSSDTSCILEREEAK